MKEYENCRLCPRGCGVDRSKMHGFCGMGNKIKVARAALHYWEEPCLSGECGSGTVFFSGCQLGCVYCQNNRISHDRYGMEIDETRLSEIFTELEDKGAYNINLVSGTQFVPSITEAVRKARENGLGIPVVFNSGGYESVETVRMLKGYVQIYLPDFKYADEKLAAKLSKAPDYVRVTKAAIDEMVNQVGKPEFSENGIMKKGVIIRHLVLPGYIENSKAVIKYLFERYGNDVWLSIMNQYTPQPGMSGNLARVLTAEEYDEVIDYASELGVENAFIQEEGTASESFIPSFDEFYGVNKR